MLCKEVRDQIGLLPRQPVGFPDGEFTVARFLGPQVPFREGRSTVAARLRPRACVPARPARSNGPSHLDAPGASVERNTVRSSTVGDSTDWVPPVASVLTGRGGVGLRLSYPAGCGREASVGVEDPVPQPGNAVTTQCGRAKINHSGGRTPVQSPNGGLFPHRVGVIPRLTPWAFASNDCKQALRYNMTADT